jgi:LmbE family N-acetylglucosaminyl deacetylase
MRSVLFVSPHADDVCLSVGGLVAQTSAPKHLLTVFSESMWAEPTWGGPREPEAVSAARVAEDRRFCSLSGLTYHSLGLADTSMRHARLLDLRTPVGDEGELVTRAAEGIRATAAEVDADVLVAPLGLGGHPDHVVCARASAEAAAGLVGAVAFYEDLPYATELRMWRIARVARRMGAREAVVFLTRATIAERVDAAGIYESQRKEAILATMAEHSARLSGRRRQDPPGYSVERLWASAPSAEALRARFAPEPPSGP